MERPTATAASTPTATPAPTGPPSLTDQPPQPEPRIPAIRHAPSSARIGALPLPPRESGEGILAVNANPWARIEVDGVRAGDTPREWRLPAGSNRLRASHPARGSAEIDLEVRAGERRTWQPRLTRP